MTVFQSLLNNDFTVWKRARSSDGQGGFTISYEQAEETIKGRAWPLSGTERTVADSEEQQITHGFACVAGEDIARGDLLGLGDQLLEVLAKRNPSLADEHWEYDCLERQYEEVMSEVGS